MTPVLDYNARVIADSTADDAEGRTHRLVTIEATYPRFVHSELMTHRDFSRNAASSRAIPVRKSIERVYAHPAYPDYWGSEKPGMQPGEHFAVGPERQAIELEWWDARDDGLRHAERLVEMGLHKSLVNRIIEPWLWITTIISSTSWENFFAQRATSRTPLAQPELARIADLMEEALNASTSTVRTATWHMPYIDDDDWDAAEKFVMHDSSDIETMIDVLCKVSVARCARVSLLNHDGSRELIADVGLYEKLVSASPMHASPLEHVAHPDPLNVQEVAVTDWRWGRQQVVGSRIVPKLGNFTGWAQLRHMVEETRAA